MLTGDRQAPRDRDQTMPGLSAGQGSCTGEEDGGDGEDRNVDCSCDE
jgi:hypothetical protein